MEIRKKGEDFEIKLSKDELKALYLFLRGSSYQQWEPEFEKEKRILSEMHQSVSREYCDSDISDSGGDYDPFSDD